MTENSTRPQRKTHITRIYTEAEMVRTWANNTSHRTNCEEKKYQGKKDKN